MTDMNDDQTPGEVIDETISMLPRPDFLNEAAPVDTLRRRGLEGLPPGSGLLVVKRGPSAGCQFRLDKPATSAGRHPGSDIFLDEVPSAANTRNSVGRTTNSTSSTSVVSTAPMSTGRPWIRRYWLMATRFKSAS